MFHCCHQFSLVAVAFGLGVHGCDLSDVSPTPFEGGSAYACAQQQLTSINTTTWTGSSVVTLVNLSLNSLTVINSEGAFQPIQSQLLYLYMDENFITRIGNSSVAGFSVLSELSLSRNRITLIEVGAFSNATRLRHLGLDFNQLSVVQPGTLDPLTNLVELYMNSNPISNFSPNLFSTMGLLQTLHLGSTNATEVGGGSFRGLRSLQILGLEGNEITRLAQGSFAELSVLRVLYLHFNNLTAVPPGAFAACATTLEELYLENNFVTAALNVTFAGLTALRILRLDSNELTTADKSVFFSMTSMQHLRLGGNWLQFDATFPTVLRSGFFNGERVASVRCLNSRNGPAYIFNREADVDCCTLGGPGSCSPPPTFRPSVAPIAPTSAPTSSAPTTIPTSPRPTTTPTSASPTRAPITATPTDLPSAVPSLPRTNAPTQRPTTQQLTGAPSRSPLVLSSQAPSASTPQIGSDSSSDSGKSTKLTVTVAIVLVLMLVGIAWILWCRARRQHRDKAPQKNSGMTPVVNVTFQPEATFHTAHSKGGIYAVPFETPNSQHVDTAVSLTHYETPEVLILGSAGAGPVRLDESNYVGTPGGLATAAESPYDTSRTQKVLYSKFCDPPEIRQSENAYATSATAVDV